MTAPVSALPAALDGFDDFVRTTMEDWKVPGLALAVVVDREVVLCKGYGDRDIEQKLDVTPHTLFPIASSTKAFTTMSLALLADEGKLDWDIPVREYLPAFRLFDPVATERMTPRDLVTHRSGLPRHDLVWYRSTASRADLFDRLRYLEPNADIRTVIQYNNLMFMTAGYLAGQLTGTSWEEVVQSRIFAPLGMAESLFTGPAVATVVNRAAPYKKNREKGLVELIPAYAVSQELELDDPLGPAGSICSTAEDMARWLLVHLNGGAHGDVQLVSRAQLDGMHTPQVVFPSSIGQFPETPHNNYALGWFVEPYRGANVVHHGGNIDGFTSLVTFMPERGVGAVILMNMDGSPVREIIANNLYDRLLGLDQIAWSERYHKLWDELDAALTQGKERSETRRVADARPSHPLQAYTGDFAHPGYGRLRVATRQADDGAPAGSGEGLMLTYNTIEMALTHYHYDIFELYAEVLDTRLKATFLTNVQGDIDRVSIPFESSVGDIVFARQPAEEMTDRRFLTRFVGEYEMLEAAVAVRLKGEHTLQLAIPGRPEIELEPYKGTEFVGKGLSDMSVEFIQDDNGVVTEARITFLGGLFSAKRTGIQS
jgi:CubicO group peptidase (beta-lactamase class C family)